LELLLRLLRVDVDARQPAAVAGVRVVPADGVVHLALVARALQELDHVLVCLVLRVDARLGTFDGQAEGVGHDECVRFNLAEH
jgi:hypothetical protein